MPAAWESAPVVGSTSDSSSAPKSAWESAPVVDKSSGDDKQPKKAFGSLFDSSDQKPGTVSTPDYLMDQVARAPFKMADFVLHGVSGTAPSDMLKLMTPEQQKDFLKAHPAAADPSKDPRNLGSRLAEYLLGKEPEPASAKQAIAGAAVGAAATGGAGEGTAAAKFLSMAKSGAFGSGQEAVVQGLTSMGVSRETADKIAMALGLGTTAAASKVAGSLGKQAAELSAVDKTKDYVANREAVNETASPTASATATQDALAAAQKAKNAAFDARDAAADSIQKAADKHVESTIAAFQPNTSLGDVAQSSLSKLNDTVRDQVKAQAQGTLQKVAETQRVDASQALALARKYEKDFAGRDAVADSAGGVAANILANTKENLGKTSAPVGSGKISSTLTQKITTDSATLDGKTAHNIIGDINDRIEGKGKYAAEKTPDVSNLLAVKRALIDAVDKSSNNAYSKYLEDYAQGMAKLDPFQRGQVADKVTADMDYDRSKVMGPGQASEMLLPKGMKGGDTASRIQSLMKDDPEFQQSVKSYVGQKLSDLKASPGGLTPQKFAQFQRDYGPAMNAYGIKVNTVQDAVQAAAARESELTAMRKATQTQRDQYNSSALAKAAGVASADHVLDPIMAGERDQNLKNMQQVVRAIKQSPQSAAALDGLRSKFNQYFFDHPGESENLANMARDSGLYTPEQAAHIRKVADSVRGLNAQQQANKMVRGTPDFENKSTTADYIVHKTAFILLSGGVGAVAGSPVGGLAAGAAAVGAQRLIARQKQMTVDAIAKIIENPEMAKVMAEKPNKANAFMADHIARQIAADVVRQSTNQQDQQAGQ